MESFTHDFRLISQLITLLFQISSLEFALIDLFLDLSNKASELIINHALYLFLIKVEAAANLIETLSHSLSLNGDILFQLAFSIF